MYDDNYDEFYESGSEELYDYDYDYDFYNDCACGFDYDYDTHHNEPSYTDSIEKTSHTLSDSFKSIDPYLPSHTSPSKDSSCKERYDESGECEDIENHIIEDSDCHSCDYNEKESDRQDIASLMSIQDYQSRIYMLEGLLAYAYSQIDAYEIRAKEATNKRRYRKCQKKIRAFREETIRHKREIEELNSCYQPIIRRMKIRKIYIAIVITICVATLAWIILYVLHTNTMMFK